MKIAPEGWPVLAVMLVVAAGITGGAWWLLPVAGVVAGVVSLLMLLWGAWFFRDPARVCPPGLAAGAIISPADGKVIKIDRAPLPPEVATRAVEQGLAQPGETFERVAIFLNLFNVHVNRVPAAGRIAALAYVPGKFFNASLDKASVHNERSIALLATPDGRGVGFVQIAGLVARRIVNHLREGQDVALGERFGLIRFGSRAEVYLPIGTSLAVRVGQAVVAGETVLAQLPAGKGKPAPSPAPVTTRHAGSLA
jgi:phosphatidylserine decarboxylase